MAAHTLTVGAVAEQGFAFELQRRIARGSLPGGTTVDQMLTTEIAGIGQAGFQLWKSATLTLAQNAVGAQVPATQATTLGNLGVSTDPATVATAAVQAGVA